MAVGKASIVIALLCSPYAMAQGEHGDHEFRSGIWAEDAGHEWQDASTLGWFGEIDLQAIEMREADPEYLRVSFTTNAPTGGPPLDFRLLAFHFEYLGRQYRLEMLEENAEPGATLYRLFGQVPDSLSASQSQNGSKLLDLPVEISGNNVEVNIPRDAVRGAREQVLLPGRLVSDIFATSYGQTRRAEVSSAAALAACTGVPAGLRYCVAEARDRLPNTGTTDPITLTQPPEAVGHLLFYSPRPERASNGEATTYLMELDIVNLASTADEVALEVLGTPSNWVVELAPSVAVQPNEHAVVPIAVSVPFQHQHGETITFEVRGRSAHDPTLELLQPFAVSWYDIPQLGGHHPVGYFHAGADGAGWWNADQSRTDEGAYINVHGTVEADLSPQNPGGGDFTTMRRLSYLPGFELGLDAVPGGTADATLVFESGVTAAGSLHVVVVHQPEGTTGGAGRTVLFSGSAPIELSEGQEVEWVGQLEIVEGDWFEPQPGNLWLELQFHLKQTPVEYVAYKTANPIPGMAPVPLRLLAEQSHIRFPLHDFHDLVSSTDLTGTAPIEIELVGNVSLLVNPGAARVVPLVIHAKQNVLAEMELAGPGAEWARIVPEGAFEVDGILEGHLVISVPSSAIAGEARGLVITVRGHDDATFQASRVVRVQVVSDPQPDDSDWARSLLATPSKSSPGPYLSWIALLAIATGLRYRNGTNH